MPPDPSPAPSRHPHHYPQPDAEGIAAVQAYYRAEQGRAISDEEAYRVLSRVLRYLWALNLARGTIPADAGLSRSLQAEEAI